MGGKHREKTAKAAADEFTINNNQQQ